MIRDGDLPAAKRPIGFWIKAADRALDQAIDAIHAANGFTRRRWQVLNLILESDAAALSDLITELAPMMDRDAATVELSALIERRFVDEVDGMLRATKAGREAHRQLAERQAELRRTAMSGIDLDDYAAAIRCLSGIVENLSSR